MDEVKKLREENKELKEQIKRLNDLLNEASIKGPSREVAKANKIYSDAKLTLKEAAEMKNSQTRNEGMRNMITKFLASDHPLVKNDKVMTIDDLFESMRTVMSRENRLIQCLGPQELGNVPIVRETHIKKVKRAIATTLGRMVKHEGAQAKRVLYCKYCKEYDGITTKAVRRTTSVWIIKDLKKLADYPAPELARMRNIGASESVSNYTSLLKTKGWSDDSIQGFGNTFYRLPNIEDEEDMQWLDEWIERNEEVIF